MKNNYIKIAELRYKYEYMAIYGIDNIDITFDIPDLIKKNLFLQKLDEHTIPYEFKWNDYVEPSKILKDIYVHHYKIDIYILKDLLEKYDKDLISQELDTCEEIINNPTEESLESTIDEINLKEHTEINVEPIFDLQEEYDEAQENENNSIYDNAYDLYNAFANIYKEFEYIDNGLEVKIILFKNLSKIESINFDKLKEVNYNENELKETSFFSKLKEHNYNEGDDEAIKKPKHNIFFIVFLFLILILVLTYYFLI